MATSTCSSRRNCVGRKPLRAIPTFSARPSFAVLLLFALVGCATRYGGRVIDVHGRPVPYARVEGHGMRGGMITGEGPFTVCAIADADVIFVGHVGVARNYHSQFPGFETAGAVNLVCRSRRF